MSLKLSDLNGDPKALAITLAPGKVLNITYYPDFISEEFEAASRALSEGQEAAKNLANMLYPVIASWDIEGTEYSRTALVPVPSVTLSKILVAIMDDSRPNSPTVEV